jgi:hypothetical protein
MEQEGTAGLESKVKDGFNQKKIRQKSFSAQAG